MSMMDELRAAAERVRVREEVAAAEYRAEMDRRLREAQAHLLGSFQFTFGPDATNLLALDAGGSEYGNVWLVAIINGRRVHLRNTMGDYGGGWSVSVPGHSLGGQLLSEIEVYGGRVEKEQMQDQADRLLAAVYRWATEVLVKHDEDDV